MAIYHLHAKAISRGDGKSAVLSAAYRSGQKLQDERYGVDRDYTRKTGIIHTEILKPSNAPAWAGDRQQLWNKVEAAETRKDAQLAREIEVSLPVELQDAPHQYKQILRLFIQTEFVKRGMVADYAIHNNPGNPHAHIMLTTRSIGPDGFGQKERQWNDRELLKGWRESWAKWVNGHFVNCGLKERIDHRTLAAQGIARTPTVHRGPGQDGQWKRVEHGLAEFGIAAKRPALQPIQKEPDTPTITRPVKAPETIQNHDPVVSVRSVPNSMVAPALEPHEQSKAIPTPSTSSPSPLPPVSPPIEDTVKKDGRTTLQRYVDELTEVIRAGDIQKVKWYLEIYDTARRNDYEKAKAALMKQVAGLANDFIREYNETGEVAKAAADKKLDDRMRTVPPKKFLESEASFEKRTEEAYQEHRKSWRADFDAAAIERVGKEKWERLKYIVKDESFKKTGVPSDRLAEVAAAAKRRMVPDPPEIAAVVKAAREFVDRQQAQERERQGRERGGRGMGL